MKQSKRILALLLTLALGLALALPALADGNEDPVSYKPVITAQPQTVTVRTGKTFTMRVEATAPGGGTLSYQWYNSAGAIAGATKAEYEGTLAEEDGAGMEYYVIITNTYTEGDEVKTASATSAQAYAYPFQGILWAFKFYFTYLFSGTAFDDNFFQPFTFVPIFIIGRVLDSYWSLISGLFS